MSGSRWHFRQDWIDHAVGHIRHAKKMTLRTKKDQFIHIDPEDGTMVTSDSPVKPGFRLWSRVTPVRAEHSMAAYAGKLQDAADAIFGAEK